MKIEQQQLLMKAQESLQAKNGMNLNKLYFNLFQQNSYRCWVSSLNPTYKIGDRTIAL